jgi:hypothetical protein
MSRLEGWGFLCLVGCTLAVTLSFSLFEGMWQAAGGGAGAVLGILSGGLYAASVRPKRCANAEPSAAADGGA